MKHVTSLRASIRLFFLYRFLMNFMLVFPVYSLLFSTRGMSLLQISLLLLIWSLSTVVLELPSGVLSDRWNRVSILLISALLRAAGYLVWIFAFDFPGLATGFVLWGAGESFASGTEEAWLYDSLKKHGREDEYDRVAGKSCFLAGAAVALSMAAGGFVASVDITLTLTGSVIACVLGMLAVLPLTDVRHMAAPVPEEKVSFLKTVHQGVDECRRSPGILTGILFLCLILSTAEFLDEYDPLFARWYGMQYSLIGIWGSLRYLLSALGSAGAWRIRKLYSARSGRYLLSALGGVCLLLPVLFQLPLLLVLYLFFYILYSALRVQTEARLQEAMKGDDRATVLSLSSLGENTAVILFSLIFGVISGYRGLQAGYAVFAVYTLVLSIIFVILRRLKGREDKASSVFEDHGRKEHSRTGGISGGKAPADAAGNR